MVDVHDNIILSYNVNFKENYLECKALNTKTKNVNSLYFEEVLTHHFENIMAGSILLEIEQSDITRFIEENKDLLISKKNYSWPIDYIELEHLQVTLQNEGYSYYVIYSSYGLCGWVLAKSIIAK